MNDHKHMTTHEQKLLRQYVASRFQDLDSVQILDVGKNDILIKNTKGDSMYLTADFSGNIYKILDDGEMKEIAKSNVQYDLVRIGLQLPITWTDVDADTVKKMLTIER